MCHSLLEVPIAESPQHLDGSREAKGGAFR